MEKACGGGGGVRGGEIEVRRWERKSADDIIGSRSQCDRHPFQLVLSSDRMSFKPLAGRKGDGERMRESGQKSGGEWEPRNVGGATMQPGEDGCRSWLARSADWRATVAGGGAYNWRKEMFGREGREGERA